MGRKTTGLRPSGHGGGVTERRNVMFYAIQNIAFKTWSLWSGLFAPLPYGDPFIATLALFVLVAFAAKIIAGGEPA